MPLLVPPIVTLKLPKGAKYQIDFMEKLLATGTAGTWKFIVDSKKEGDTEVSFLLRFNKSPRVAEELRSDVH